ncbi:hypothetical protein Dsin_008610 [Dipteronia sinensis]|uniref:SWIM-type domain-containing protein n=1 Tax=Dipteronia sinensis TaxID=43782 RepID=A0AAE0APQ6_9ROSI|nr:hypothetical protein Dsin_008610 [Dipteronia sinensis]
MGAKKLVIHHGGSWAANCYEGGMTKWVHVPIGLTYDDLVKLVQDVAKVDAHRSTLELCSLTFTTTGTARLRIENDKDVSCMMDEDKLLPEVYVTVSKKVATHSCGSIPMLDPIVCNDETIDDEENSESSDTDNRDDSSIPDIDRGSHGDEDCNHSVGSGAGSVGGYGCAGPSGFATFSGDSFREDGLGDGVDQSCENASPRAWIIPGSERYSFEPISTEESISDDGRLYKGKIFQCKKDLKRTLHMYALKEQFEVRIKRSSKTRYEAGCKDGECEFQLRAFKMQKGEYWVVRMFLKDHTCNIDGFHARLRQANSWTVGELLAPKLQVHGHSLKPKDIMVEMQVDHGLHLLYTKAWRAKDHAEASVFGPPEESFKLLPAYCHRLKEVNPGTITTMKTNVANQFEYLFIAHAASLHGFHTVIRPVISIDGTHLKGIFSGIMFVAICLDANNQVFPLAYGFGDVEDEMSWTWFLNELKNAIGSPKDCMIISDRHLGIKAAMEKVYPNVPHGYCVFHMAQNIKNDYKRKDVSLLFKQAWKAYRKADFKEVMLEMMKVNRVAFKDLMNVGPERWSRAYSPVRRYRLMTSSIAESMNSCLVHARQMPITTMVEFIREMLQKWFYKRRTKAEKTRTQLTPWATELIKERNKDSEKYTVRPIDSVNFNVKDGNKDGLVNLSEKTCSCTKFQVDKLPCRHALAAIRYAKKPFPDFCGDCYKTTSWLEAYSGNIFPVGHPSEWNIPQDMRSKVVHPPPFRAQAGRPKKKRFKSAGEHGNGKTRNCTICKKSGHNRQNCKRTQPCQAPQPCPSATSATSSTSKRPRRPYRCRKCGEEGHNSQKCPLTSDVGGTT